MAAMRVLRAGMVLWGWCMGLVIAACLVGLMMPSHQIAYLARYSLTDEQSISIVDIAHDLSLPLRGHFVVLPDGILGFRREEEGLIFTEPFRSSRDFLIPDTEGVAGWIDAAWSPDSTRLALVSAAANNSFSLNPRIFISDGVTLRNLMPQRTFRSIGGIVWSPDGTRIAFVAYERVRSFPAIYVLQVNSGSILQLSPDDAYVGQAAWSPDSTQLAFAMAPDVAADIYVINVDGSNLRNLTDSPAYELTPQWSPDGTRIAFASRLDDSTEIYVMDSNGSHVQRLTNDLRDELSPQWSPDGEYIVYETRNSSFNTQVHIMRADGSDQQQISYTGLTGSSPVWLP